MFPRELLLLPYVACFDVLNHFGKVYKLLVQFFKVSTSIPAVRMDAGVWSDVKCVSTGWRPGELPRSRTLATTSDQSSSSSSTMSKYSVKSSMRLSIESLEAFCCLFCLNSFENLVPKTDGMQWKSSFNNCLYVLRLYQLYSIKYRYKVPRFIYNGLRLSTYFSIVSDHLCGHSGVSRVNVYTTFMPSIHFLPCRSF